MLANKSQFKSCIISIATSRISHIININNIDIPRKRSPTLMWSPYVTVWWGRVDNIIYELTAKVNQ